MTEGPDPDLSKRIAEAKARQDAEIAARDAKHKASDGSASAAGHALRYGAEFGVSVFVGGFIGYWIDAVFATKPLWLLIMGTLGLAAGFRSVYRAYKELNAQAMASVERADPPEKED